MLPEEIFSMIECSRIPDGIFASCHSWPRMKRGLWNRLASDCQVPDRSVFDVALLWGLWSPKIRPLGGDGRHISVLSLFNEVTQVSSAPGADGPQARPPLMPDRWRCEHLTNSNTMQYHTILYIYIQYQARPPRELEV